LRAAGASASCGADTLAGMVDGLEAARYSRMRWNTPLSGEHAELLLDRLEIPPGASITDLGCGWGELLIRAVAAGEAHRDQPCRGVGVDTDAALLEHGRALAAARGLEGRIEFVCQQATSWVQPASRVICVGATHAFGSLRATLDALAPVVLPGGRLLFGDGCWEKPPTPAASALFGPSVQPLAGVLATARAAGWRVLHLSTADQREWDDFESTWKTGRHEWLLANENDPRAPAVGKELDEQLKEYVSTYRGVLGFCYLVLTRDPLGVS
jgi:SAM-dependent methyltransferase